MAEHALNAPFQILWGNPGVLVQAPAVGGNVLVIKQPVGPNSGTNTWIQCKAGGRIYLADSEGRPTRYCLDVNLPDAHDAQGAFPAANGCMVYLNDDIPQRQTQLWTVTDGPEGGMLVNVGLSISIPEGPGKGPYVLDSGASGAPGSVVKVWQQQAGNRNQLWLLKAPGG